SPAEADPQQPSQMLERSPVSTSRLADEAEGLDSRSPDRLEGSRQLPQPSQLLESPGPTADGSTKLPSQLLEPSRDTMTRARSPSGLQAGGGTLQPTQTPVRPLRPAGEEEESPLRLWASWRPPEGTTPGDALQLLSELFETSHGPTTRQAPASVAKPSSSQEAWPTAEGEVNFLGPSFLESPSSDMLVEPLKLGGSEPPEQVVAESKQDSAEGSPDFEEPRQSPRSPASVSEVSPASPSAELLSEAEQLMMEEADRLHRELRRRQSAAARGAEELSRLKLLVGLGSERRRCHRCDLAICSLRRLLRAVGEVCVVAAEPNEGSQPLFEMAEILASVAHVDSRLAELGT
ncbi:PDE9A, partial [Symbiodinium pilosum]